VRGAFTGAHTNKKGLFEAAAGGTLFLDEIGDMPISLQSKLLRVLQDKEIRPVGGNQSVKVDVRIIAATHQDMNKAIAEGRFRQDLYYRLNVIPVRIPPLRERAEDIPVLVQHFVRRYADELGKRVEGMDAEAYEVLSRHAFPGNVRELENLIERAVALSRGPTIGIDLLPSSVVQARERREVSRIPSVSSRTTSARS
jgi:transcriptional regulator with PAS, ATPase and Fis domain